MRGQPVHALSPRSSTLVPACEAALAGGRESLDLDIAGVRYRVTVQPLVAEREHIVGVVGVAVALHQHLHYQTLVEASPLCIHTIDTDRKFSSINSVGLRMLGATHSDDVIGRPYLSVTHPDDVGHVHEVIERAFAGETLDFEFRSRDGRPMLSWLVPVDGGGGRVTSLLGFTEDVSPQVETLTRLRESEERHRVLVEKAPYCIHELSIGGCLTSMNPAGLQMMGVEDESAIVGLHYLDVVAESDRPRIAKLLANAQEGHVSMFEFESTSGQFFRSHFVPIVDSRDRVVRMMGLTEDITEQKLAERALRASERRLELALQGGELGLWDLDLRTQTVVLIERWSSTLGLSTVSTSSRFEDRMTQVHPEDSVHVRARLAAHLNGDSPSFASEHRVSAADGSWRWVQERGAVVEWDEAGRPLRVTGTAQDLTERRQAEQEHRALEAQLQQAQKMESIGQLAGGIAHDFNNLLAVISGHAEIAALSLQDSEEVSTSLVAIGRAADRAASLTRQLLAFSRQEQIQRRALDLNEHVRALMKMLGRLLPKSIDIALELAEDLPMVSADPTQLEQVIMNLCVNARDAMTAGGVLSLSTSRGGSADSPGSGMVRLTIRDEGVGMDETVQARIFDPFFTTKPAGEGTGLGLSMVYGIIKQHEGDISVRSSPGLGSTFVIDLPATTQEPAGPVRTRKALRGKGQLILVADDEELVRSMVVSALEQAGFRVLAARDGVEAVALFERHRREIQLALLDVVMPRLGGYQALEKIAALDPGIRALMTSGYSGPPRRSMSSASPPVLVKPYRMQTLLERVHEALGDQAE